MDFIEGYRPHLKALLERSQQKRQLFTPESTIRVDGFGLWFQKAPVEGLRAQFREGTMVILYSGSVDFQDETVQGVIQRMAEKGLRLAASTFLRDRLERLSREHHLPFSSFRATATRSVWGSCSRDNVIALSCYLMLLPAHLQDFVILHELTHTVHKNHGTEFHGFLDGLLMGREKALKTELRRYRTGF